MSKELALSLSDEQTASRVPRNLNSNRGSPLSTSHGPWKSPLEEGFSSHSKPHNPARRGRGNVTRGPCRTAHCPRDYLPHRPRSGLPATKGDEGRRYSTYPPERSREEKTGSLRMRRVQVVSVPRPSDRPERRLGLLIQLPSSKTHQLPHMAWPFPLARFLQFSQCSTAYVDCGQPVTPTPA
jgi:hypothetical protein